MMEAGQPEVISENMNPSNMPTNQSESTNTSIGNDDGCQQTPNSLFYMILISLLGIIRFRKLKSKS
jgi:hypothetical protein